MECPYFDFLCPWDGDSFTIYTRWSWKKMRCEMSTTQNVIERMKEKCDDLGTCDGSTTWYEDVKMDCSVREEYIQYLFKADINPFDGDLNPFNDKGDKTNFGSIAQWTHVDEYKVLFNDACVMHDICYKSGNINNRSRSICDDEFHDNMLSMCKYTHDILSPQTRYKEVGIKSINCAFWAWVYSGAVRLGGSAPWKRGLDFHEDHNCSSAITPLTNEENLKELIDQQRRDLESYKYNNNDNNDNNPNNEPISVLNDIEWEMNILLAFVAGIVIVLCCITFYQYLAYCAKEKSINYSKVSPNNTDSDADVLVNVYK